MASTYGNRCENRSRTASSRTTRPGQSPYESRRPTSRVPNQRSRQTSDASFRDSTSRSSTLPRATNNEFDDDDRRSAYSMVFDDRSRKDESRSNHQQVSRCRENSSQTNRNPVKVNTMIECGLIILGNSGVGKSFLANILLGRDAFAHEVRSSSVTHTTDFQEIAVGHVALAIFDIPGLIEAEQRRVESNKKEIHKAFLARPNSIIVYVFGTQNGRIRDEDVVAFKAINAAYSFKHEALAVVVNGLPRSRARDYEGTTVVLLQQLLPEVGIHSGNVWFLDDIDVDSRQEKLFLKEQLLKAVVDNTPMVHRKTQDIETLSDRLQVEMRKIRDQQAQFQADRSRFQQQIAESQRLLDKAVADHQNEAQSYHRAMERQEEMFKQQQRQFEEEREKYNNQLNALREQMSQAKLDHRALSEDPRATERALEESREAVKDLKKSLDKLQEKFQNQQTQKSRSCVIA